MRRNYDSINKVTYAIVEERYSFGNTSRTSYGIVALSDPDKDGSATIVASVHDITSDKDAIVALVDDCNRLELSTIHLLDVVEDFI